jgi:hypothetical protein
VSRSPDVDQLDAGYDVRAMCGGLRYVDVLVSDAWIDGLELLEESRDGKAVGRRGGVEQERLLDLRHGWYYVVG